MRQQWVIVNGKEVPTSLRDVVNKVRVTFEEVTLLENFKVHAKYALKTSKAY